MDESHLVQIVDTKSNFGRVEPEWQRNKNNLMVGRRSTAAALPDAVFVEVVVHPLHEAEQVSPAVVLHGQVEVGAVLEGVV